MPQDAINIRITDDGGLVIETDGISPANHKSADAAITALIEAMGGHVTITPRTPDQAQHTHTHGTTVHTHR